MFSKKYSARLSSISIAILMFGVEANAAIDTADTLTEFQVLQNYTQTASPTTVSMYVAKAGKFVAERLKGYNDSKLEKFASIEKLSAANIKLLDKISTLEKAFADLPLGQQLNLFGPGGPASNAAVAVQREKLVALAKLSAAREPIANFSLSLGRTAVGLGIIADVLTIENSNQIIFEDKVGGAARATAQVDLVASVTSLSAVTAGLQGTLSGISILGGSALAAGIAISGAVGIGVLIGKGVVALSSWSDPVFERSKAISRDIGDELNLFQTAVAKQIEQTTERGLRSGATLDEIRSAVQRDVDIIAQRFSQNFAPGSSLHNRIFPNGYLAELAAATTFGDNKLREQYLETQTIISTFAYRSLPSILNDSGWNATNVVLIQARELEQELSANQAALTAELNDLQSIAKVEKTLLDGMASAVGVMSGALPDSANNRTPNQPRTPPITQPTEVVVTTTAQEDQKIRTPNVTAADISSVLVVPDAPSRAGDPVTGVLTVTNTGPAAARNVVAKVTLPSGEVVDVQIGTIQPGQSVAVTVKSFTPYIVGTGLTLAAKWSALISASSPDPNMLNNQVNARQNIVTAVYVPPAPMPGAFLPSPIAAVASASPIPSIPSLGSPAPGTANMVGGGILTALGSMGISALTVDGAGNTYGIGFKNGFTQGGAGPVPFRRHPGSDHAYYLSKPVLFKVSAAGSVTKTDLSDAYVDEYYRGAAIGFVNNTVQVFFNTKPVDGGYAMEGAQRTFDPVTLVQTAANQLFTSADSGFYPIITPQGVVVSSSICAFTDSACGAIDQQATTAGDLLQAAWLGFTSNGLKNSLGSSFGLEGVSSAYRLAGFSKPIVEGGAGVANSGYSYVSWGRWADGPDTIPTNVSDLNRNGAWLAGQLTNGADIPVTGAATFNGVALGNATMSASATRSTPIAGMHTANVDFATRSIAGSFTNLTSTAVGGPATVWLANANYTASWRASQNQILGSVTPAANLSATAPGAVAGGFFGPGAAELGGRFIIQKADGTNATGIFTGKR